MNTKIAYGLILIIFANFFYGQRRSMKVDFRDEYGLISYSYKRLYISDCIIREKSLFSRDTLNNNQTTDIFRIVNKKWYFKKNNSWHLFFDKTKQIKSTFIINGVPHKLYWKKVKLRREKSKEPIFELKLTPVGINISSVPHYMFSPSIGFVAIDGENTLLIRTNQKIFTIDDFYSTMSAKATKE